MEKEPLLEVDIHKKYNRPRRATPRQKKFAKNYLKAMGNQRLAYQMTYPQAKLSTAGVNACVALKNPVVRNEISKLLDKQGMPRDYFLKKMKDLAECVDKNGVPIAGVQWDVVKTGLEFHGIIKKQEAPRDITQINYNLDAEKLGGVLDKLSEVTRKLELSKSIQTQGVENAEIIDGTEGILDIEKDTGSQECDDGAVQP